MDHSATLHLTDKGTDEVAHRTFKLGIKLRSVLLMLHTPHTVEFALQKSVLPKEEIIGAIDTLVQGGFVELGQSTPAAAAVAVFSEAATKTPPVAAIPPAAPTPTAARGAPIGALELNQEIVLSEAKFLLIDFCVDCFGMQAEKLTEEIRACKTVGTMQVLVTELADMVGKHKPEHRAALHEAVRAINETA